MRIKTNASAGMQTIDQLLSDFSGPAPDFLMVACSSSFDLSSLEHSLEKVGCRVVHGVTSCLGVMTNRGMVGQAGDGIGYFALWDDVGAFGTAGVEITGDPSGAAQRATRLALKRAGRPGEAPDLIWVSASPGQEEAIIQGIEDVVGGSIPIVGGSAADNTVEGNWAIFGNDGVLPDGVQITVLFPSAPLAAEFQSGYAPTGKTARVTNAVGRRLYELDGRPAVEVYQELSGLKFSLPDRGDTTSVLSQSSFNPLGLEIGGVGDIPYFLLMHAAVVHDDGSIEFFADVKKGAVLHFMAGSPESLTSRAGRVAAQSRRHVDVPDSPPAGALMIYCAGCMLSVQQHMNEVAAGVDQSLDGAPFLGVFTFGEQGYALNHQNSHGNLMISCVTFSA